MATQQATLTPTTDQTPVTVSIPTKELSGTQWVARFPTSTSVGDLTTEFEASVNKFIAAIKEAGGSVAISATYRPKERAYLMHYSSAISKGIIAPEDVPEMDGVNIEWVHSTSAQSISAATSMASGYGIVYPPALTSRHTQRKAIDMTISNMSGKTIVNASGASVLITHLSDLNPVGTTYGVKKLVSDPPHWSTDAH